MKTILTVGVLAAALIASTANAAGDATRGESLYEARCGGCHALDSNRVGPMHRGVFGRKAGSVSAFNYSAAVRGSKIQWNDQTLDKWLANPEALIPGQRMGYRVEDATDRLDIISYLKRESGG